MLLGGRSIRFACFSRIYLFMLKSLALFDFLPHLSYNIRNGEVCPFSEMIGENAADSHGIYHENILMTEGNRVRQYGKG